MRESITQEFDYGCGIACFAFALDITYEEAANLLGEKQALSERFWIKDLVKELNKHGKAYHAKHIKPSLKTRIYGEGVILLIRRSKRYPAGHYLIRHNNAWMDPWVNLSVNKDISKARSGFRKRLPGNPMYALFPNPKTT